MAESSVHRKPVKPIQPGNSTSIINHKGSSDFSVSELLPAVAESNSNTGSYSFVNDDSSRNSSALNTMRSKLSRSFTANLFLNHHSNVSGNHKVDEEILKTLYVPDSLCDTDRISPSLWKWINDEDLISKKEESINLPLFELKTAKGEKIEIPHRLLDELNEKETSSIKLISIFNRPKNYSIGASENRCRKKIPRFFIEVDELHLKPKYANEDKRLQVVVESQTFVSGPFAWKKDAKESKNEFRLSTSPRVAMIFDVPETEFTITLKIISGKDANTNLSSLESNSSSIESFNTQGQRARVPTRLVQSIFRHRRETTAANILLTEDGVARSTKGENEVVCQLGFTFPSDRTWPKVAGSYPLNSFTKGPRKEVGKVSLQMGLFLDEEYLYEEPLVEENAEYFDVYIHTSRASIWRKYWAILRREKLEFFNFEYKENCPPIGTIPLESITSVAKTNAESVFVDNCFQINVDGSFLEPQLSLNASNFKKSRETMKSIIEGEENVEFPINAAPDIQWRHRVATEEIGTESEGKVIYIATRTPEIQQTWKNLVSDGSQAYKSWLQSKRFDSENKYQHLPVAAE